MCRFILYQGPPVLLSTLLIEPSHSLIHQSVKSHEREEPLNGDGFGVGWYVREYSEEPAVFRSITPAWNNRNLHNLARVVTSTSIFAHVRAATRSSGVNEANCHPFRYGRYLFMHNGDVGNFPIVRRRLLETVCDEAFANVFGSTDSEHVFAVFIDELLKTGRRTAMDLARALDGTIQRIVQLVEEHGEGEASYLNVAVGDGTSAVVSRYTDNAQVHPESLYWYHGDLYRNVDQPGDETVVSSEKLTEDNDWHEVPANHMVVLEAGMKPLVIPCGLRQQMVEAV